MAAVRRERPQARLLIAGTGPMREEYRALVRQMGLEGTIFTFKSNSLQAVLDLFLKRDEHFFAVCQSHPDHPWIFQAWKTTCPSCPDRERQGAPDRFFNGFKDGINPRFFNISKEFKSKVDLLGNHPPHIRVG